MLITKLIPQKRGTRFNLFIDEVFAFGIGTFVASKYKLTEGKQLTNDELLRLFIDEQVEYLKQKSLDYLAARPRSKKEVKIQLQKKLKVPQIILNIKAKFDVNEKIINEVFVFLKKYNYVNDVDFANWLVKQRLNQGKGEQFIKQDLFTKGVNVNVINQVVQKLDSTDSLKKAYNKALKKYKSEKNKYKKKQKIYRYLLTKGFNYDDVFNLKDK